MTKRLAAFILLIRRSSQSGVTVCPALLVEIFEFVSNLMLPGMQLRSDTPEDLKALANSIIDRASDHTTTAAGYTTIDSPPEPAIATTQPAVSNATHPQRNRQPPVRYGDFVSH